jgi:hypothetical protein
MAKKKETKNKVDSKLDIDMDDLGDDLDFGELEDIDNNRNPSKAEISKELVKEAGKGFLDSVAKKTAAKALPEEYTNHYHEAMEYADLAKETFDANKSKVNKSLYKLGKEVKKILPFQSKMLDKFISKYETDFEEFKTQTQEQLREGNIQSNISSIFDKQLDIQKAFEAKRSAESEVDKKDRIVNNKLNLDILSSIDGNVSNQTAFTLQISKEFYRKSLELQYKSYFIQADMLTTMRDYYKGFSLQFDNIVKNTGLPDFVKLHTTEAVKEIMRQQTVQSVNKQLFSNNEYVANIKKKFSNLVSEKVSGVTDGIDNITDAVGGMNQAGEMGGGGLRLLAGIGAALGGSAFGEKISEKISPKIKDKLKNNKTINTGANYLSMMSKSPSTFFGSLREKTGKKAEEYSDESNPMRLLASKLFSGADELLGVTDPGKTEYKIEKKSILTHNKPAIFDNNVHRSITEVIPMYLSKILNENVNLRQMYKVVNVDKLGRYKDTEEKVYDYENRKLSTAGEFKASIQKSLLKSVDKQSGKVNKISSNITNSAITSLNKTGDKDGVNLLKNKKMQSLFETYLTSAGEKIADKDFTFDNVVTNYKNNLELNDLVKDNPKLQQYLDLINKTKLSKEDKSLNDKMLDVKRVYPISAVKDLFSMTSVIAESKTKNNIKDDVANIVSKILSSYVTTGRDLLVSNVINSRCFELATKEQMDIIEPFVKRFIGEVKVIVSMDDEYKISSLQVRLGIVTSSLREKADVDPSILQTLNDYSSSLQGEGVLTTENYIEGKIGIFDNSDNLVGMDRLREISKVKLKGMKEIGTKNASGNVFDKIYNSALGQEAGKYGKIISELKDNLGKADGYKDISNAVVGMVKDVVKQSKETALSFYNEASGKLSELNTFIDAKVKEKAPVVKNGIISLTDKFAKEVDRLIAKEKLSKEDTINKLNEVRQALADNVNDSISSSIMEKQLSSLNKLKDIEIKTLENFKKKLAVFRNSIINIETPEGMDVLDFYRQVKSNFETLIKEWNSIMEDIKQKAEAHAEATAAIA